MPLAKMVGVDGDTADERVRRALATDRNPDRLLAVEGDHATRAPEVQLADLLLEAGDGERRYAREVREAAAVPRVDEQGDVVGATEAVRAQFEPRFLIVYRGNSSRRTRRNVSSRSRSCASTNARSASLIDVW